MRVLLLFIAITLPLAWLFGSDEYESRQKAAEVASNPAFAPATFDTLLKTESSKNVSYRVRFRYQVDGKHYSVTTTSTDQQGALRYIADPNTQVAYSLRNPSVGMLKRYYDLRDTHGTLAQGLTVTTLIALGISIPLTLVLSWRLGWFRRRQAA